MSPRDRWMNSPEGRWIQRRSKLTLLICEALFTDEPPNTGGKTIGQVYTELAATTDYTLEEVADQFLKLCDGHQIYRANTTKPTENSKWRIMQ